MINTHEYLARRCINKDILLGIKQHDAKLTCSRCLTQQAIRVLAAS
jgi:hypothetical protein